MEIGTCPAFFVIFSIDFNIFKPNLMGKGFLLISSLILSDSLFAKQHKIKVPIVNGPGNHDWRFTIDKQFVFVMLLLFPLFLTACRTGTKPNDEFTTNAIQALQKWYKPETGLWETTGWWNAANALTGIIRYSAVTGDKSFEKIIENTFQKAKKFTIPANEKQHERTVENFINDYYDDEGWWALAWVEAFDLKGKQEYLEMAKIIFEDMKNGWEEKCNGGIYWKKGLPYKSAISNELFMLLAGRLALRDEHKSYYKSWALKEWDWFSKTGMITDLPLVQDGVRGNCEARGRYYTYNQGVILAALVDLFKLTNDEKYTALASKIALAAIQNMSTSEGVLKGMPKQEDGADGVQFKGIFMRHLAYLYKQTQNIKLKEYILANARYIKTSASKKGTFLIGSQWEGPFDSADAGRQSSAIDALVSALEVKNCTFLN